MHKSQITSKQLCLASEAWNAGSNELTCLENWWFIGK